MKADTQAITIDASLSKVFRFVSNPENLPHWARAFCQAIRPDGDAWLVTSPQGEVRVRYRTDEALGVIDFHLSPAPGVEALAASRVLPNGDGAAYVFTQFQTPGMPDDVFTGQVHALREELLILKALLEGRTVEAAPSCAPVRYGFQLGVERRDPNRLVAILGALFQSCQEFARRIAAVRGLGEEEIVFRVPEGQHALDHVADGQRRHLVDARAPGWPGAREDDLPDQLRLFLRDHLRDETAKGEAKQVDLSKTEGPDEGDCVPRHRLH